MYVCVRHHEFITSSDLVSCLEEAIKAAEDGDVVSSAVAHDRIKKMYTWNNVAKRTEKVSNVIV